MKRIRILAALAVIVLALSFIPADAYAVNNKRTTNITVTVGDTKQVTVYTADSKGKEAPLQGFSFVNVSDLPSWISPSSFQLSPWETSERVVCTVNNPDKPGKYTFKMHVDCAYAEGREYSWVEVTVNITVKSNELTITKRPTGEKVNEGGKAVFIAKAENYNDLFWTFTKGLEALFPEDALKTFPGLKISGQDTGTLVLSNIPAALDGWSVFCTFVSTTDQKETKYALITVHSHTFEGAWGCDDTKHWQTCSCGEKGNVSEHTFEAWTTEVVPTKTSEGLQTRKCTVCGYVQKEILPVSDHEHYYPETWNMNKTDHWHECTCGTKINEAPHTFGEWKTKKKATSKKEGIEERQCSVCGYTEQRAIPKKESSGASLGWMIAAIVAIAIALGVVIGVLITFGSRRKNEDDDDDEYEDEEDEGDE